MCLEVHISIYIHIYLYINFTYVHTYIYRERGGSHLEFLQSSIAPFNKMPRCSLGYKTSICMYECLGYCLEAYMCTFLYTHVLSIYQYIHIYIYIYIHIHMYTLHPRRPKKTESQLRSRALRRMLVPTLSFESVLAHWQVLGALEGALLGFRN